MKRQMMVARATLTLLAALSILISGMISGCTQKRQSQTQAAAGNSNQSLSTDMGGPSANYSYPHAAGWKSNHIGYYARFSQSIQGSDHDCTRCHSQGQNNGSQKNLSCAIQCHKPVKTPDGSIPISNPTISASGQACVECHKGAFTQPKQHYPAAAGLCDVCHTVNPTHLTDKLKSTVVTNKTNSVCIGCHGKMDTHANVHKALQLNDKSCISCHKPHGSNFNFFTKSKLPDLCLQCHDDLIDDNAKSIHGIIPGTDDNKRSCANCHNPHSSDIKKLLVQEKKTLCVSCHDREYQTKYTDGSPRTIPSIKEKITGKNAHPIAVNSANCTLCHTPHASLNDALLLKKFPVSPYEKYIPTTAIAPGTYELCMGCHDESMLGKTISEEDTDFRNETKAADGTVAIENLHWFHVVNAAGSTDPDKGRSCFVCHDPHGSTQAHTIKTSFRMSAATNVNVTYSATKTGGSCANTCHSEPVKQYNRLQ